MGLAGRGLARHGRLGTCYEYRHPVDEARQGLGGALRGRGPPPKEGPQGPTAHNGGGQWSEKGLTLTRSLSRDGWGSAATWGMGNFTTHCGMHAF